MNKIFLFALMLPLCAYSQELCDENDKSKTLNEEVRINKDFGGIDAL